MIAFQIEFHKRYRSICLDQLSIDSLVLVGSVIGVDSGEGGVVIPVGSVEGATVVSVGWGAGVSVAAVAQADNTMASRTTIINSFFISPFSY